tara:strand:- start:188 stop:634 length:447 start_codon:yes stop_codon:yes gene_type:complete
MSKINKSSDKNIYKSKADFTFTEFDIENKDGSVKRVVVPDGKIGYGDDKSHVQMTEDIVGKHSDNETAVKAGEAAREQLDQDQKKRWIDNVFSKAKGKMTPLDIKVAYDKTTNEPVDYIITLLKTEANGLQYPLTKIVNIETGKVRNA